MYNRLLAATLLLFFTLPSTFADEAQSTKPQSKDGTYLNLSVTERTEALEDILVANLSSDFPRPMMLTNSKAISTEMPNPVAEPDKKEVTIAVSAKALLQ